MYPGKPGWPGTAMQGPAVLLLASHTGGVPGILHGLLGTLVRY